MRYFVLALALLCSGTAFAQEVSDAKGGDIPAAVVADVGPAVVAEPVADAAPAVVVPDAGVSEVSADAGKVATADPAPPVVVVTPPKPALPVTDAEAGSMLGAMIDAAQGSHWNVFGGLLVLLLVWLFNRLGLKAKFGSKVVPWVSLITGAVAGVAIGMASGAPFVDALKFGLMDGAMAVSFWELAKGLFQPKPTPPPAVVASPEGTPTPAAA